MVILITTPFFNNLGGSELEIINTANLVSKQRRVKKVIIFSPTSVNLSFTQDIHLNKKIIFKSYPNWLQKIRYHKAYKKVLRDFGLKTDILAILFWKCFFCKTIQGIYILSKSSSDYFHPIIETYKKKNRIIIKYTTILYGPISEYRRNLLKSVKVNVVTSPKQAKHFKDILDIENVETQEIIIRKENYALENVLVSENFDFDFGIISRLSREKQIEHALDLIILLNRKGFRKNLFIKGEGDLEYINELNSKILTNNLTEQVVIEHIPVHPDKVIQEFPRFRCFLITSKFEGGPNIGLELMAAGKPMISYKVGAMEDRLKNFPQLLASNLEEMVEKSLKVLNAPHKEYITICKSLQEEYSNNYRNIYKEKNIIKNLGLEDLN